MMATLIIVVTLPRVVVTLPTRGPAGSTIRCSTVASGFEVHVQPLAHTRPSPTALAQSPGTGCPGPRVQAQVVLDLEYRHRSWT